MAISYVGSNGGNAINAGSITVSLSGGTISGIAANDLIIVAYGVGDDDFTQPTLAITTAGYTEVTSSTLSADGGAAGDANLAVFYKFHNGSDTNVVTTAAGTGADSSTAVSVAVFRGVKLVADGGPFDVTSTTNSGTSGGDPNPPSINHTATSGIWIVVAGMVGSSAAVALNAAPTNYTLARNDTGDDSFDAGVAIAYRSAGFSDPEDPGVFTDSGAGAAWAAVTMALSEASAPVINGVVLTVTPSLPVGLLDHALTGTVLTATPSLPTGDVTVPSSAAAQGPLIFLWTTAGTAGQTITGTVLTATPTLPTGSLTHTLTGVVLTVTPSLPTGKLNHSITGVVVTATPSLPTGSLQHRITGTVLTVTPSLPTGSLTHTITGTVLTVTPTLPTGQVTIPGAQTVTGLVLTVTPSLPVGTLTHTLTGVVVTATPTLPTGSLRHSLTGVVLTVTPTLPTGSLRHTITGVTLTVTPTLPVGQVTVPGSETITGVVLQITPTLPVGSLRHTITGVVLTATPSLPTGTLNHSVRGVVITITPTLPTGTVTRSLTGVTLTATPTLPIGTVGVFKLLGVAVEITPTLPTGLVTTVALGTLVKGPTRKVVLEGPNEASELVGAPSAVHIGAGRNSSEEL